MTSVDVHVVSPGSPGIVGNRKHFMLYLLIYDNISIFKTPPPTVNCLS